MRLRAIVAGCVAAGLLAGLALPEPRPQKLDWLQHLTAQCYANGLAENDAVHAQPGGWKRLPPDVRDMINASRELCGVPHR